MKLYLNVALAIYIPARGGGWLILNCAALLIFAFLRKLIKEVGGNSSKQATLPFYMSLLSAPASIYLPCIPNFCWQLLTSFSSSYLTLSPIFSLLGGCRLTSSPLLFSPTPGHNLHLTLLLFLPQTPLPHLFSLPTLAFPEK